MKGVKAFFTGTAPYLLSAGILSFLQIFRARSLSSFHDLEARLFVALAAGVILAWGGVAAARRILSRDAGEGEEQRSPARAPQALFEEEGLSLFLVSLFFFTQLNWARENGSYGDVGIRLLLAFLAGVLLARGLESLLRASTPDPSSFAAARRRLSLSLSPGVLFILAPAQISLLVITPLLCLAAAAVSLLARRGETAEAPGALFPLLLVIIVILGVSLRLWGMDYPRDHPDGAKQVTAAMKFVYGDYTFSLGHPRSDVSGYPYFAMHIVELSYRASDPLLRHLFPRHKTPRASKAQGDAAFKIFLRNLARWLNVLYQLAAMVLLYVAGRRLFGPAAGVFAAGLMAFSSLQIQMSHVVNADVPSAFFVLVSIFLALEIRRRETPLGYLGAGAAAGFAAAAKYHGVFALFFLFLVFLELRWRKADWRDSPGGSVLPALWAPLGFVFAFFLATPALLLDLGGTLSAMADYRSDMSDYNVPVEYIHRRGALFLHQLPNHLNSFLRFFEPLPGWAAAAALLLFCIRRGRRDAVLWVFPLVIFPLGNFTHNTSVSYHYLGILLPLYLIAGYAAAAAFGALRPTALRRAASLLFLSLLFLGAASDASMFSLPPTLDLARDWIGDTGNDGRFRIHKSKDEDRRPRILGVPLGGDSALVTRPSPFTAPPVALFDMERRDPTLNNCRNRPVGIHWADDRVRPLDLLPHPRRIVAQRDALLFPDNLTPSRDPSFFRLRPGAPFTRRIRFDDDSEWLLYARYSPSRPGGGPAILDVRLPGNRKRFTLEEDADLLEPLEVTRPDLLYNRLFATVTLVSNRSPAVRLVSPRERGWFYLMTERWRELEEWERGKADRGARLRRAVALHRLGTREQGDGRLLGEVEHLMEEIREDGTVEIFRDPAPAFPLYRFAVIGDERKEHWPEIRTGETLYGPYATLVPGFYRAVFSLTVSPGGTEAEYRVTSETGRNLLASRGEELPAGRAEAALPFRVTPGDPGWQAEFLLENRGGGTIRIDGVRVENDVDALLDWWARETRAALGEGT